MADEQSVNLVQWEQTEDGTERRMTVVNEFNPWPRSRGNPYHEYVDPIYDPPGPDVIDRTLEALTAAVGTILIGGCLAICSALCPLGERKCLPCSSEF